MHLSLYIYTRLFSYTVWHVYVDIDVLAVAYQNWKELDYINNKVVKKKATSLGAPPAPKCMDALRGVFLSTLE